MTLVQNIHDDGDRLNFCDLSDNFEKSVTNVSLTISYAELFENIRSEKVSFAAAHRKLTDIIEAKSLFYCFIVLSVAAYGTNLLARCYEVSFQRICY